MSAERGRVQRFMDRLYRRIGPRVVLVCLGSAVVLSLVTAAVTMVWLSRYLRLSTSDVLVIGAVCIPLLLGALAAAMIVSWRWVRLLLAWRGEGRNRQSAPRVWRAAVTSPYVGFRRTAVAGFAVLVPMTACVVLVSGAPAYSAIPILIAILVGGAAAGAITTFTIEQLMRPMLEDVAAFLPADFKPRGSALRLRTKALLPLPVFAFFTALTVGAFVDASASGPTRLAVAVGIATATVAVAGAVFLLVTRSLLDPIDELIAATRRVGEGDISAAVPVLTGDELGQLASSFNQMLRDLGRHEGELRASRERIVAAAVDERRRVERDLHDGAQQRLVLINLKLGRTKRLLAADPSAAAQTIDELQAEMHRALAELRDLAHGIYPSALADDGLRDALEEAVGRASIPSELACNGVGRYRPEVEAAVYFCCLEALQNAAKHAGEGARATVRLEPGSGTLEFAVADDGRGFDSTRVTHGAGVQNMTDRIGALGGTLLIDSEPGHGTTVRGVIPV